MKVIYQSKHYNPDHTYGKCFRFDGEQFYLYEGWLNGLDHRQGTVEADELPDDVRRLAQELAGTFPGYVKWEKVK